MLTLVTAFFDLAKREQSSRRPAMDYLKHGEYILNLPYPLVIFADPEFVEPIQKMRGEKPAQIIGMPFESVPKYHLMEAIQAARKANPVQNASALKDTANYILLTWTKFDLVEKVVAENPFASTHFAWIDFGLTHVAKLDFAEEAFQHVVDPIKLLVNKWASSDELQAPDYYSLLRGYVAGGFMTGSLASWQQFIRLFHSEATQCLEMKRAPSEEQIIPQIMQKHPDLFEAYYGDYDGILSNYHRQRLSMPITNYNLWVCLGRRMWYRVYQICQRVDGSDLKTDANYQHLVIFRPKVHLIVVTPKFLGWPAYTGAHGVIVVNSGENKTLSGDRLLVYRTGDDVSGVAELFGRSAERTFFLRLEAEMSLVEVKGLPDANVTSYWIKHRRTSEMVEYQHRLFRADTNGLDESRNYLDITIA